MRKTIWVLITAVLLLKVVATGALADHEEDGLYEIPTRDTWTKGDLSVLIVPPESGQLYNDYGPMANADPQEVTPFENSYLRAIEDSISEWQKGIRMFGSARLRKLIDIKTYVLGRDDVPPEVLTAPDILLVTDPNKTFVLGFALYVTPCVVNNSRMLTQSFTYADMYNVNGQEFGHCLGLGHVGSQGGADPTSAVMHPLHDVMNGFYADPVGAKGNHLHCVSNLDVKGLEWTFKVLRGSGESSVVYQPARKYRTTCGGDGRPSPQDKAGR
jgi:hypothetical protein